MQADQDRASCQYAATVARVQGDTHCQELIDLPQMPRAFYSCEGLDGGLDASPDN